MSDLMSSAAAGPLVFVSAVSSADLEAGASVADETRSCLAELGRQLEERGSGLRCLIKASCFLSNDAYRAEFWATWSEVFTGVDMKLVRLTQVASAGGERRVLIDAVAVRGDHEATGVGR